MKQDKVEYKGVELELLWQEDHLKKKEQEFNDRKQSKSDKIKKVKEAKEAAEKKEAEEEESKEDDFKLPTGAILVISGLNDETMREDLKEKLSEDCQVDKDEDIAFIYYNKGESEAKLRFRKENRAKEVLEKIQKIENFEVKGAKVEVKVLEGEEETEFLKQALEDMKKVRQGRRGHKRRGGFGGRGRGGKRGRN